MALRVLLPRICIQKLLHLRHPRVGFRTEPELNLDEGLEARVKIGHTEIDELGQFGEELLVQCLIGSFGEVRLPLCARELRGVFIGLFDEFLHLSTGGVVIEELVIALFLCIH